MAKPSIISGLRFHDRIVEKTYQEKNIEYDWSSFLISSVQTLLILFFLWVISYDSEIKSVFPWWPLIFVGLIFVFLYLAKRQKWLILWLSIIINLFSLVAMIEYLFAEEMTVTKTFFLGWAVSHLTFEVFYCLKSVVLKSVLMFMTNLYCFVRIGVELDPLIIILVAFNFCKVINNFKEEIEKRRNYQDSFVQLKNLEYYKDVLDKGIHSGVAILSLRKNRPKNTTNNMDYKYFFDIPYVNYPGRALLQMKNDNDLFEILDAIPIDTPDPQPKAKNTNDERLLTDSNSLLIHIQNELENMEQQSKEEIALSSKSWVDTMFKEIVNISIKKNGEEINFDLTASKFLRDEITSIILIFNDISDKVVKERLSALNKHKDHLLATVSHELKTPLNAIFGYTTELLSKNLSNDVFEHLTQIKINSKLLQYQIDNILDFSQLTENKLTMNHLKFNLNTIINQIRSMIIYTVEQKGLKLSLNLDVNCPDEITSDPHRLKQLLMILLGNSLKFTFNGSIEITIEREDNNVLRFKIKDTGIGIEEERKKNLFCLFHPEKELEKNQINQHGVGLGLTLSKCLVDKLGPPQQIVLNSECGKGTEISFLIYIDSQKRDSHEKKTLFTRLGSIKPSIVVQNKLELTPVVSRRLFDKNQTFVKKTSISQVEIQNDLKTKFRNPSIKEVDEVSEEQIMKQLPRESKIECSHITLRDLNERIMTFRKIAHEDTLAHLETFQDSSARGLMKRSNSYSSYESEHYEDNSKKTDTPSQEKANHNFLIVDDTPLNLLILETFILAENKTNSVVKVYNGQQAVDAMLKQPAYFDLVFMDCNMPVMNGYEATIKLKELMKNKIVEECPILAISAYCKITEDSKWREAGMDEFIQKPLTKNQFQEIYKIWVNKKSNRKSYC